MSKSDYAIRVEGIGKRYRLGLQQAGGMYSYKSLRDTLGQVARKPWTAVSALAGQGPMTEENSFWALKDVSFDIKKGEVVGIIGRNGAGKSTLLKILSRITKPTTGRIDLYGRVGSLLEVGTGFHPELTGRENIYLNGAILGMTQAEVKKQFDGIVNFSEIEKFIDMPVKQYSSGMYTRLAFAVAAHLEPEILVVDEVLAVGDAAFQKKCIGKMQEVADRGRTVIFVSHNMSAIESLCQSGVLLSKGCIAQAGNVSDSIAAYLQDNKGTITYSGRTKIGDDRLTVLNISALDENGISRSTFDCTEPIVISVKYEAVSRIQGARFNLHVLTSEGERAFSSTDCGFRSDTQNVGIYETRCRIPGRLLNRKSYDIEISCYVPPSDIIVPRTRVLSFEVIGQGNQGPNFEAAWPGAVCPALTWIVEERNQPTN